MATSRVMTSSLIFLGTICLQALHAQDSANLATISAPAVGDPTNFPNPKFYEKSTKYCYGAGSNYWKTFDGAEFIFEGCCSYTLLQDSKRWISLKNLQCGFAGRAKEFTIKPDGAHTIVATCSNITVNDEAVQVNNLNLGYAKGAVRINKFGEYYVLRYGTLTMGWDCDGSWFIELDEPINFDNSTNPFKGMCGNYDGVAKNDLLINGEDVGVLKFGDSHSFNFEQCPKPEDPPKCSNNVILLEAKEVCSSFTKSPFSECHNKVSYESFYSRCINDYCLAAEQLPGQQHVSNDVACNIFAQYSFLCGKEQFWFNWRTEAFCTKQCANPIMKFVEDFSECTPSCLNVDSTETCIAKNKYPACTCSNGYLSDGDSCYLPMDCPCTFRGQTYAAGEYVQTDCEKCFCTFGKLECTHYNLAKTCSIYGFEHVTTFDGYDYSFKTPVDQYTLVQSTIERGEPGYLHISFENLNAGSPEFFYTRPTSLKIEFSSNPSQNVILVAEVKKHKFVVSINDVVKDFTKESSCQENNVTVALIRDNALIINGDGFQVRMMSGGDLFVRLGLNYMSKTNGLCGNYNGKEDDEFMSKDGIVETKESFLKSFSGSHKCFNTSKTDPCTSNTAVAASGKLQEKCNLLTDPTVLGAPCAGARFNKQNKDYYYEACLEDLCVEINAPDLGGDAPLPSVCHYIEAKALYCLKNGISVFGWPNKTIATTFCRELFQFSQSCL
ncbi:hypothetical protein HELRODRAFT_179029 [Helobdella robusta]|uniref:VWFD domain-containing protein n=1 Tax=Helobdella robusta TaxID=6412 RepID=T1FE27_HELRO|nr:hypothetical protein HELRODRAFT_179029 [Helobdella robusta]ESN95839.1 hypothetical protein HELRODRAFT_179029 [Helobdella robusta]